MNLFIIIILFIEYILVKCLYSDYYINNMGEREYPKEYQVTIKLWVFVIWVGGSLAAFVAKYVLDTEAGAPGVEQEKDEAIT